MKCHNDTDELLFCLAFSSYGGFWLSYATIFIPGSNILAAYTNDVELGHAIGFYLAAWFIFTFFMLYVHFCYFWLFINNNFIA